MDQKPIRRVNITRQDASGFDSTTIPRLILVTASKLALRTARAAPTSELISARAERHTSCPHPTPFVESQQAP